MAGARCTSMRYTIDKQSVEASVTEGSRNTSTCAAACHPQLATDFSTTDEREEQILLIIKVLAYANEGCVFSHMSRPLHRWGCGESCGACHHRTQTPATPKKAVRHYFQCTLINSPPTRTKTKMRAKNPAPSFAPCGSANLYIPENMCQSRLALPTKQAETSHPGG